MRAAVERALEGTEPHVLRGRARGEQRSRLLHPQSKLKNYREDCVIKLTLTRPPS